MIGRECILYHGIHHHQNDHWDNYCVFTFSMHLLQIQDGVCSPFLLCWRKQGNSEFMPAACSGSIRVANTKPWGPDHECHNCYLKGQHVINRSTTQQQGAVLGPLVGNLFGFFLGVSSKWQIFNTSWYDCMMVWLYICFIHLGNGDAEMNVPLALMISRVTFILESFDSTARESFFMMDSIFVNDGLK